MSRIGNAIKKALASMQAVALPHENPAPAEGTAMSEVVPAPPPSTENIAASNAGEAGRIIKQLAPRPVQQQKLDVETRRRIIESLNRFGPPRNAFVENRETGACFNFDGTPADLGQGYAEMPVRVRDTHSDVLAEAPAIDVNRKAVAQPLTSALRHMSPEEYLEYKRNREGKE